MQSGRTTAASKAIPRIILLAGRDKSLLRKHPWVFSQAIARTEGSPRAGQVVRVESHSGAFLGWGGFSPDSSLPVRICSFREERLPDESWLRSRLAEAVAVRRNLHLIGEETNACRLVHGENDGLPGLVVDLYGDYLVCQFLWHGMEPWRAKVVEILRDHFPGAGLVERSEGQSRKREGLPERKELLAGASPPATVAIVEEGRRYRVDLLQGQKTGFYLDQRENRGWLSRSQPLGRVLNGFGYTGGFTVAALRGGAESVLHCDTSPEALRLTEANLAENQLDASRVSLLKEDMFQLLRRLSEAGERFDTIVLDPPKFAEHKAQVIRACRGYKDLNRLAMGLLRPGGVLFTFSCSAHVEFPLFQKVVADAALDAGREARIERRLFQ
ncbi:MAG: class I SAM-dependent rRNA methyltransferase, partial [Magnetococcales bacterium]|nr:class I SAM-dependent rRNA methyltransferase [Magnetococcales bacterium]